MNRHLQKRTNIINECIQVIKYNTGSNTLHLISSRFELDLGQLISV